MNDIIHSVYVDVCGFIIINQQIHVTHMSYVANICLKRTKPIHHAIRFALRNCMSCLISRHEKALEGITVCGEIRGRERFIPIIMGLGMMDNTLMQVACIQLVNALVSTPDDLDFRLHLRNEFMRTGIIDLITVS